MTARAAKSARSEEIAAIEDLMGDLDKRLRRLSGTARREASGATGDVGDFVSEALARIMTRVHDSASGATRSVINEVEHRPLVMIGLAAGVGFLVGMSHKR
jgi:ElaB/YqjD/DUF883 family membrane-anchored ribosome-binding protein